MASHPHQAKINQILEKKKLYNKRVADARDKNRPDIEKIWLDEIKVLEEEYNELMAVQKGTDPIPKSVAVKAPQPSAKNDRKLRQLNNQIQYIKRKISIHSERGEQAAVHKQTALLNELLDEKEKLTKVQTQATTSKEPVTDTATAPTEKTKSVPLSASQQNKVNALNADIAHADKMIKEYQRFKSPKAQHWIGRKFQLVAQRDQLIKPGQPQIPPPIPVKETSNVKPNTTKPSAVRPDIDNAQTAAFTTNQLVRVLDLEIAHADKMVREYTKYNSPKANQWIHRKNELLARRAQITGHTPKPSAPTQEAAIEKRLRVIGLELAHTEKMIKEYKKYNSPKVHEWKDKRDNLLAEKAQLQGRPTPVTPHQPATTQTTDRNAIKAQIVDLNGKAKDADIRMRTALKQGDHKLANDYHHQRDQYNNQVKELTALLTGASVATTTTPQTPATPQTPISTSTGSADAVEKNIAHKYLTTRNYSNEHAYKEIIDILLTQGKYQHLTTAKETLYDITNASKLPPAGTMINNPYIRDCFKIKVSNVRLEGYTINDTIFDTSFPRDFNRKVDRINQHIGPAPELKHYKYLAHRDAIQLIPSDRSISRYNSQFAGAKLHDIVIKNITVNSQGSLQGIFASDGAFENIHFENITVQTASAHEIAILGLLSGTLDLSSSNGKAIHVNLLPLRLAGGRNIYINSFSRRSSYQYGKVNAGRSNAIIADNRQKMSKRGTYYSYFDIDAFFDAMRRSDSKVHILTRIEESAKMAGTVAKVIK